MKRKALFAILVGVAALLLIAASILLLVEFDSPEIGKTLLSKLEESTDLQWEAKQFRLNLLRGLYLENVTTRGRVSGKRMEAQIKSITVKHRLIPLLGGEISAKEVVVEDPEVDLFDITPEDQSSPAPNREKQKRTEAKQPHTPEANEEPLKLGISQMRVKNALITVHSNRGRKPDTVIQSLSLTLNDLALNEEPATAIQRFSAEGKFQAEEIRIGKASIQKNEGNIAIADGEIHAKKLIFETKEGKFQADLVLNLKSSPARYKLLLKGDPLDTNLILGGTDRDKLGSTRMEFQGEGIGTKSGDLRGRGKFTIENGELPSIPIFATIDMIIGQTKIVGAPYKAGATTFRIQDKRVHLEEFSLQIEQGSMDLSGWVGLDGLLQLRCTVRVPRQNVKIRGVPKVVLDALTDDSERISLPFEITGTPENPLTLLDTRALLAQMDEGTRRLMKQKLNDKIKSFLKKKDR